MKRAALVAILVIGLCLGAARAWAQQAGRPEAHWPQFRGPGGSGLAPEGMRLPVDFGPGKNALWKTALPPGHSSPCIWGDRIFLTGFDKAAGKLETLGIDRASGRILWRRTAPARRLERVHAISTPANPTPAADAERVYVYFGSYGLLCYDFEGRPQWNLPLAVPRMADGMGTSPIVAGDLVLLHCESPPNPCLLAVDRRTGRIVWRHDRLPSVLGIPSHATPVLWSRGDVEEVILHTTMRVAAHGLEDGRERWWMSVATTGCGTPVVGEGRLFVATWIHGGEPADRVRLPDFDELVNRHDKDRDGRLSRREFPPDLTFIRRPETGDVDGAELKLIEFFDDLDADKDGRLDRDEWAGLLSSPFNRVDHGLIAIGPGGSGDVTATGVLWQQKQAVPEVPSPLCYRRRVYMVRDGGIVSSLDAHTGKLLYRERLAAGGGYFASPVAGDGKVYLASGRGVVTVLAAGDAFRPLAANDLGEPVFATPAIAEGNLYVRTQRHLYAFGQ